VAAESGWVNKFEGDGAMCVFGAPDPMRDHAARALRASRSMRAELRRLTSEHPGLDAGIGVSAGSVVAGNIGAAERYEYTVIGDPVNEASRLTEAAKTYDGRVLASARAVREAGDEAGAWRPVGCLELRGRTRPTDVYEPVL
jgi:adenylate cyclase